MLRRLRHLYKLSLSEFLIFTQLVFFAALARIGLSFLPLQRLLNILTVAATNRFLRQFPLFHVWVFPLPRRERVRVRVMQRVPLLARPAVQTTPSVIPAKAGIQGQEMCHCEERSDEAISESHCSVRCAHDQSLLHLANLAAR